LAKYPKQLQVCTQPSNTKICSKSACFNIILHPINCSKLKEKSAGGSSQAGKSMLPSASVVPKGQQVEKGWKTASVRSVQQEGWVCIIHPLLLSLFAMTTLCHVLSAQQGKRHIAASSYVLGGSRGHQDVPLSCPAVDKRPQIQPASLAIRYLEKYFQRKGSQTLQQSPVLGDTTTSARQGPEQCNPCCTCCE